jgi:hypothetical protein
MPKAMIAQGFRRKEKYSAESMNKAKLQPSCKPDLQHQHASTQIQSNLEAQTNDQGLEVGAGLAPLPHGEPD